MPLPHGPHRGGSVSVIGRTDRDGVDRLADFVEYILRKSVNSFGF
jgi:hypothetical protein